MQPSNGLSPYGSYHDASSLSTPSVFSLQPLPPPVPWEEQLLNYKLAHPSIRYNSTQSLALLMHCIALGKAQATLAAGKQLVFLLGNTGAGKSTFANYLCGCTLQRVWPKMIGLVGYEEVVVVKPVAQGGGREEAVAIGHGSASKTFMPQIASGLQGVNFCDCPGFFDNRGWEIKIANAVNVKNMANASADVRVILLISFDSIKTERGRGLKELFKTACTLFGNIETLVQCKGSILFGITHIPRTQSTSLQPIDDLKQTLCADETLTELERWGLQHLVEQLFIFDPLDAPLIYEGALKQGDVLQAIAHLMPLQNPRNFFRTALMSEELQELESLAHGIKSAMAAIFNQGRLTASDFHHLSAYLESLQNLSVLEHPATLRIVDEAREQVIRYFDTLKHHFDLQCQQGHEAISQEAGATLKSIREGIQYFDAQIQAAAQVPSLEERYSQFLAKRRAERRMKDLREMERDFYRNCSARHLSKAKNLLNQIESCLNRYQKNFLQPGEALPCDLVQLREAYASAEKRENEAQAQSQKDRQKLEELEKKVANINLSPSNPSLNPFSISSDTRKEYNEAEDEYSKLQQTLDLFISKCTQLKSREARIHLDILGPAVHAYNKKFGHVKRCMINLSQCEQDCRDAEARAQQIKQDREADEKWEKQRKAEREAEEREEKRLNQQFLYSSMMGRPFGYVPPIMPYYPPHPVCPPAPPGYAPIFPG